MPTPDPRPALSRRNLLAGGAGGLLLATTTTGPALADRRPPAGPDPAAAWHRVTAAAVAAAAFPEPVIQSRAWAVSWLAAARATGRGGPWPGQVAALATALRDSLRAIVPGYGDQLDSAWSATLAGLPDGRATAAGVRRGAQEAAAVLGRRQGDGLDVASVQAAWTPPPAAPGSWQPTPPTYGPAVRAGQGRATPFLLRRPDQFRPGPPAGLDSARYRADLAEVRAVGRDTSTTRSAGQTAVARFWAQNSIDAYIQLLDQLTADPTVPLSRRAALVAAFHVVTTDAQIAVYDAKYTYVFWRPVTALRTGPVDPDPDWTPLIATPRHPEYPSGHTGYAEAAQRVLEAFTGRGPERALSVSSSTADGAVRSYTRWATLTQENVDARVWSGIHYRSSDLTGARLGARVAEHGLGRLHTWGL